MTAEAVGTFGRLDVAVANAYYSAREPFWEADMEKFRRTVDVTLWGAFYTLRAATRALRTTPTLVPPPSTGDPPASSR